jgi:ABC-type sugar transport system ATPase subunit
MIELEDVTIRSGPFLLSNISAEIPSGAYCALMGETGRGKTTILEAICGLRTVAAGRILLDGTDVTRWKPAARNIGYVPQDLALFPTMTVRGHLEFALRLRNASAARIRARVDELAGVLGIGPLLERRIRGLSGGEAQRVGLGRALSFRPRFLLLDEPLNALDETTRDRLCDLLRTLHRHEGLTTLHVTHGRAEAARTADRLLVLADGRLQHRPLDDLDPSAAARPAEPSSVSSATVRV